MTLAAQNLQYTDDATTLDGVVVLHEGRSDQRPGILLIHGGAGLDDHARGQAHRYAELGYVVFACDMYGPGIAGDRERVMATLMGLRDAPDRLAQRAAAGLAALSARAEVNGRLAAVGFCFGGLAALTLARSGAGLAAAVSMHGSLATTKRAEPGAVTAKVLVCHGALDPHVPMANVVAFTEEMWSAPVSLEAPKLADLPIEYHPQALYSRLPRTFSEAYPRRMSGSDHRYTTEPSQP